MNCPVCRAENEDGPDCRRCRADLSMLFALDRRRSECVRQAIRHINAGNCNAALASATEAHAMRADDDSTKLLAMCHIMYQNFARARNCLQSLSETGHQGKTVTRTP